MSKRFLAIALIFTATATAAQAEDYVIIIKDHKFSPAELIIPADQKVKVIVKNTDATAEEFESSDLNREKVVSANSEITVNIGPLKAGTYKYVGEFNQATAKGTITAK